MKKIPVLKRYPPGDRWIPYEIDVDELNVDSKPLPLFNSLTDGLEWIYKTYDSKKFIVDAELQIVYLIEDDEEQESKSSNKSKYSIYGE